MLLILVQGVSQIISIKHAYVLKIFGLSCLTSVRTDCVLEEFEGGPPSFCSLYRKCFQEGLSCSTCATQQILEHQIQHPMVTAL